MGRSGSGCAPPPAAALAAGVASGAPAHEARGAVRPGWRAATALPGDVALALLVGLATYASVAAQRYQLGTADEAYFLVEAARIRAGEVMYRDFFNFITPLSSYALGALFWLFGTTLATARHATAVLHAVTAVALYATARRLAVGRGLALLAPLAFVALCQPVWPFASWHWVSTGVTTLLVYAFVAAPPHQPAWRTLLPGLLAGVLIGVQQQKGIVLYAGGAAVLVADAAVARRGSGAWPGRALAAHLAWFTAGAALVVLPVLAVFLALAGPTALYDGLVRFPLESYRPNIRTVWGAVGPVAQPFAGHALPAVLRLAPLALVPVAIDLAVALRRGDSGRARRLSALLVLAAASVASIAYYPDFIHIAFIAGVFWVAAVCGLERGLTLLPHRGLATAARALVGLALAVALVLQAYRFAAQVRQAFPVVHDTAFGRVHFPSTLEPAQIDQVRALAAAGALRELFSYPHAASPYLTTGLPNATPYQFLAFGISPRAHIDHALAILRRRRLPYVIGSPFLVRRNDPVMAYIRAHYEMVPLPDGVDGMPSWFLYRRRADAAAD